MRQCWFLCCFVLVPRVLYDGVPYEILSMFDYSSTAVVGGTFCCELPDVRGKQDGSSTSCMHPFHRTSDRRVATLGSSCMASVRIGA